MLKILSNILCDLDPKVKVIGQKAGICDGVPSTSALVIIIIIISIIIIIINALHTLIDHITFKMMQVECYYTLCCECVR